MSHHRSRSRVESPEEPAERISVFERLGRKRMNAPTGRPTEYPTESDLRNRMSRKRVASDVSPTRQSVSPVRLHSALLDKSETNSKVKSLVMAPHVRPESPISRKSKHSSHLWNDDIDSDALELKRLELQKELQELEKTDKREKNLSIVADQPPMDTKISSRSSSIISSESSSTLKSLTKTESSENSDLKVIKSELIIKEEKSVKVVDIKHTEKSRSHISSSISVKSVAHVDDQSRAKMSEVKYDRHGNIRVSLDDLERQKRLRAERFGPIDVLQPKRVTDRKVVITKDRSHSPSSKRSKTSSHHHISDTLHPDDRRRDDSHYKHGSTHSKYDAYGRSISRERSLSSKRDDTRSKVDSDRSSRTALDSKYGESSHDYHRRYSERDNTSVTSKTSNKRIDNYSREHSPARSITSKISHGRESSIGSDFSRRSKSERMSTQSIDALLTSSHNQSISDVKTVEQKASDPAIEEMSPISADGSLSDVDMDSSKQEDKPKSLVGSPPSSKKGMAAEGDSFSDWSEDEDEILLKNDDFQTLDEVNMSDNSLDKDTLYPKSSNKKSNGEMAHNKDDALEAISDDEFDAIIGESDPIDSLSESRRQVLDALDIDWKSLLTDTKPKLEFVPGSARARFNPANVLMRIGFSHSLAGAEMTNKLTEFCKQELKEEFVPFRHPVAAVHSFISDRIRERQQVFGADTTQSTVLSGRKDLQIRKMLNKTNFKLFGDNSLNTDQSSSVVTSEPTSSVNDSLVSSTNPIESNAKDIECF